MPDMILRDAMRNDAAEIAAIYSHHVLNGTATFDLIPPTVADWERKIVAIAERGWPFIVSAIDSVVVGYAYATQFRDRPAYARSCENSIYVAPHQLGQGLGGSLIAALCDKASACGFEQMVPVIGGAEPASVAAHRKHGFVDAGRLRNIGEKFGRSLDTVYMQRDLRSNIDV